MAGQGREVGFHGAFATKAKAKAKERETPNSYIQRVKMKGKVRYLVITRTGGKPSRHTPAIDAGGGFRLPNIF